MTSEQRILGIDPGTNRLGWAIVDGNHISQKLIDYGCLETPKDLSPAQRLLDLHDGLVDIINIHKPSISAVEELFFFKNAKTVIRVAEARGVIVLTAKKQGLKVYDYTPLQIKQAVTGYGRADKKQVQQMVKTILKLPKIPRPDDAADAIAVSLTHCFTHRY